MLGHVRDVHGRQRRLLLEVGMAARDAVDGAEDGEDDGAPRGDEPRGVDATHRLGSDLARRGAVVRGVRAKSNRSRGREVLDTRSARA